MITSEEREAEERRSTLPPPRGDWTDERIETLKALWMDGLSAAHIADMLGGGLTRNAVLGKVHRMRLASHGRNDPKPPRPHRKSDGTKPHGNRGKTKASTIVARIARKMRGPELDAAPLPEEDEGVDVAHLIGLLQLNEHTCKWPIGDPLKPEFGFCGHQSAAGLPYCERHARRAYAGTAQ